MRKLVGAVTAAALLVSAGGVLAADEVTGKVMLYDEATRMLTLENGVTFLVEEGAAAENLEDGQAVTVFYEKRNGQATATEVRPADAQGQGAGAAAQDAGPAQQDQESAGTQ